jgi:Tol biopolymer transport system component
MVAATMPVFSQFYNGDQLTFGKNRVQYVNNFWTFYKFNKFDVYFYTGGKPLAIYTAKYAESCVSSIEKKLDYNIENKIQFVVFNRLSDLKQSNIGLVSDEQYNIGGVTHIVGSKVFIYYDGSHVNLEKQIKAGIANVVLNELIYGNKITAKIKNSTLLTLPDWYLNGLISYLSEDWSVELDNYVKDGILNKNYEKFNRLSGTDAVYAGHSIWKYIADKYGEDKISNIIYMTKISRSVESGFLYVLGTSFKSFTRDWYNYYDKKYYDYDKEQSLPQGSKLVKNKKADKVFDQLKISPDGNYAAYVTNQIGKSKVYLYSFDKKKKKKIRRFGYKLDDKTDYSVPIIAWHPQSKRLAFMTEKKGKILLFYYNLDDKSYEKTRIFDFQKVLDFSYSQNGKLLAMSGVMNGQNDIFVYNLGAHTYEQLTKDIYDDRNPVFINNSKDIIFSSNRTNDTIKSPSRDSTTIADSKQDLFLYDYAHKSKILHRLTNTPLANETKPVNLGDNYFSYLSDQNGITNRCTARFDSAIDFIDTATHYRFYTTVFPQTNYSRSVFDYDACQNAGKCGEIIYNKGLYQVFMSDLPQLNNLTKTELKNTPYMDEYLKAKSIKETAIIDNKEKTKTKGTGNTTNKNKAKSAPDTTKFVHKHFSTIHTGDTAQAKNKVDINNYSFKKDNETVKNEKYQENKKQDTITSKKTDTTKIKVVKKPDFILPIQRNYDVEYTIDQLAGQIDFSFMNDEYQPFTNEGAPIYLNSGFDLMFKVGVTDLLEDYRITGGISFPINLGGSEYMLSIENLKKRLDKQLIFHRQTVENTIDSIHVVKDATNEVLYVLKWPFSDILALKGTGLVRNDRTAFLATDINSLQRPNIYTTWGGLKAELTFDNTITKGLNLYYGTRWKMFAETYRQINNQDKQIYVLGFDYRHYQKISRTFIWANRFAASTSFGTQKLVYYMGGEDGWIFPHFDNNINVATDQNYAFQTLATPLRGFDQNIRNGNSFAVINSELRFPIFRYFINHPLKSGFFNNFQIVAFGDIGTAWNGPNPYSDKNALYTNTVENGPIIVIIKNQIEPIVGGYGFGLRSKLLGYFIRADWAWGVENGAVIPKAKFYLSLGLDF